MDLETRLIHCMVTLQGFHEAACTRPRRRFGRGEMANLVALATYVATQSKGMRFNLPQNTPQEKAMYEVGKRLFFQRGGTHDFSCASCHGDDGKRIRLQDLPNLTKNPGDGVGFAAWPAYRVSNAQMWTMQKRLNDCYRQQRFPEPKFGSDVTIALGVYMGVNAKGAESIVPAIKR
jgi:L-cysteine S-thiosulfotransferase